MIDDEVELEALFRKQVKEFAIQATVNMFALAFVSDLILVIHKARTLRLPLYSLLNI